MALVAAVLDRKYPPGSAESLSPEPTLSLKPIIDIVAVLQPAPFETRVRFGRALIRADGVVDTLTMIVAILRITI